MLSDRPPMLCARCRPDARPRRLPRRPAARAGARFLDAAGHGLDVAADRVGVALLRLGIFLGILGQPVQLRGHSAQRGGRVDDLADGALQLVEEAVEQLDHGADLVVGLDGDTPGQVAIAAGNGLQ